MGATLSPDPTLGFDLPKDRAAFDWMEVASVSHDGLHKKLRLADGSTLLVHPYPSVGRGDTVRRDAEGKVSVQAGTFVLPVTPTFRAEYRHTLAPQLAINVVVREIESAEDLAAYRSLSQFHYRSDRAFGRRAILVLEILNGTYPRYVGFVELATPFLHLRNRNDLFDAAFHQPGQAVSWEKWDLETRTRLINTVARISRIVVHPELRGLGFYRPLIAAVSAFARERWQVGGIRPLFIEITADMLRFMPFVTSGGLRYIGESGGNLNRIAKDMGYLSRTETARDTGVHAELDAHSVLSGRGKGILKRQKRDLGTINALRDRLAPGEDMPTFFARLLSSEDVDAATAELLLPLLRHPKPTYLRGLTDAAEAFVSRRIRELRIATPVVDLDPSPPQTGILAVDGLTVAYRVDTGPLTSAGGSDVRRAFGLDRSFRLRTGITNLSFSVKPGQICYLYGASGSGKTTLMNLLAGRALEAVGASVDGRIRLPAGAVVGEMSPPKRDVPLINAISARNLDQAIYALNSAGLSEPRLYLTHFDALSTGQQYRAALARLICSASNVWLLDEFAAGLDDPTAIAVGRHFGRAARRSGALVVMATVRGYPLINAIEPDLVVQLTQLEEATVQGDWEQWQRSRTA